MQKILFVLLRLKVNLTCKLSISERILHRTLFDLFSDIYKINEETTINVKCNETSSCVLKPPDLASFPEPKFFWTFRKNTNETFSTIEDIHGRSDMFVESIEGYLCILGVSQTHQGQYRCEVNNTAGTVYQLYNVTIGKKCWCDVRQYTD